MSKSWPEFLYPFGDIVLRLGSILTRAHPLHRREPIRPFFIIGSGRSGTTLLRRILLSSGQVHIPPETYMIGPAVSFFRRNRDRSWAHLVRSVLAMFEFDADFDVFEVSLRPLANELLSVPRESRSLALILDRFYRYHGEQTGQKVGRWGDKTTVNTFRTSEILAVFPHAQFVHMYRDGADVVHSFIQAGILPSLDAAAERWRTSLRTARAFVRRHGDLCAELRYEDLVAEPALQVEAVCRFLGIDFRPAMVDQLDTTRTMGDVGRYDHLANVTKPITTESIGKGRRSFTQAERAELQSLIGPELRALGYEPLA